MTVSLMGRMRGLSGGEGLKGKSIRAVGYSMVRFGANSGLRLVSNVILARLLAPDDFGLMAIVVVVLMAIEMVSDLGVTTTILRHPRGGEADFLGTAFTLQTLRGAFIMAIVMISAPFAASFYDQPELTDMLRVAAISALLTGLSSPLFALADRNLAPRRATFVSLLGQILSIIVTAVLAWELRSAWALVIGSVLGTAIRCALSHLLMRGPPIRFRWDEDARRSMLDYGRFILLATFSTFVMSQGTQAMLAKFVSLSELGVFNIGMTFATLPYALSLGVYHNVMVPVIARNHPRENPSALRNLRRLRIGLAGVFIAMSLALAFAGPTIVGTLYTDNYALAGPVVVTLALAFLPLNITLAYGAVLQAAGDGRRYTVTQVCYAGTQLVVLYFGIVNLGLLGAIISTPIAAAISYPVLAWAVRRQNGWDPALDAALAAAMLAAAALPLAIHPEAVSALLAGHAG